MPQVHIAITRRVRPGQEAAFQAALKEFASQSLGFPGTTGVHLVGPVGGDERDYGILRSFESAQACESFYASDLFADWMRGTEHLAEEQWVRQELTGMEAFFRGRGAPPPRWKMAVVTWLGVYPTVLVWSAVLAAPMSGAPRYVATAISIALSVVTLTWLVMPLLTKLFAPWLNRHAPRPVAHRSTPD
ncbi:antibiotic biosynthesis monooxygenase [Botrimarina sp.]|uniref:antibiotic biosynthesis monooxygenase n=1 Tax=Botrimarina sp. TaxID=2795802 RepID=UPI0032EB9A22